MTSKEALKSLKTYIKDCICNYEKEYTPFDIQKFFFKEKFEIIEKDLEVLEILKEFLKEVNLDWEFGKNEKTDKVKEWLEDE